MQTLLVETAADLDTTACLEVVDGRPLALAIPMLAALRARRRSLLERLQTGDAVYGVTTGMGASSTIRLDPDAQALQQENLMLARAIGSAPWLSVIETRAAMVVRLATFLTLDAGVSAELCEELVTMLNVGVHPAVPATRLGAAGEIIPLAHLGGALTGSGRLLGVGAGAGGNAGAGGAGGADGTVAAPRRLALGPKEGVAMIEGVPVTTGLAMLRSRDARILASQITTALAAELDLLGIGRDPYHAELSRGDDLLGSVLAEIRTLAGPARPADTLQAPLSFRVVGPALATLERTVRAVDEAVARALSGVTDSPAFLGDRFVGTAGFDGFDLASTMDGLRVAVIHLAEVSAARLHRMLDDRVTGLPRQLSSRPGLNAGMVTVHKRAVGVVHELVRSSAPAGLGAIETSLGQEDVQAFSVASAMALGAALDGTRDVLACELLALVQAVRLAGGAGSGGAGPGGAGSGWAGSGGAAGSDGAAPGGAGSGGAVPGGAESGGAESGGAESGGAASGGEVSAGPAHPALEFVEVVNTALPPGIADRPFGLDIELITRILGDGWAR